MTTSANFPRPRIVRTFGRRPRGSSSGTDRASNAARGSRGAAVYQKSSEIVMHTLTHSLKRVRNSLDETRSGFWQPPPYLLLPYSISFFPVSGVHLQPETFGLYLIWSLRFRVDTSLRPTHRQRPHFFPSRSRDR